MNLKQEMSKPSTNKENDVEKSMLSTDKENT
jgi:hypothetical protein